MAIKELNETAKINLANTYLKVIYNNLVKSPFKTFDDFVKAVFTDKITGETYLEDRIALGDSINSYLGIIWKTKSGLEKIYKDLAKAAGSGKYPSKSAIWQALTKDVSKISVGEYLKLSTVGTASAVKSAGKGLMEVAEAGKEGLTVMLRYAPVIIGVLGASVLAFFVYKTKKLTK